MGIQACFGGFQGVSVSVFGRSEEFARVILPISGTLLDVSKAFQKRFSSTATETIRTRIRTTSRQAKALLALTESLQDPRRGNGGKTSMLR